MRYKLETIGLGKRYGESVALAPTDLQVRAGEFLTLLGPSGSGKTTLLQMISGLTLPSSGTLLLDGVDATQMPPGKRGIGMVFQNYALFPHMTVWENVAYGLRMRRAPADEPSAPWPRRWRWSRWTSTRTATRASCPAGSSSASRWRAASSIARR